MITNNHAGGFGGGIAGCSTGRLNIAVQDRCANFDNDADGTHISGSNSTKNDDHRYGADDPVFMANGYRDYYCALSSVVSGGMLGGGVQMWHGSADGVPVNSSERTDELIAASVILTIEGLAEGTYTITELKAPDGYNMLEEPITLVITANNVTFDSCDWSATVDGNNATIEDGVITFEVENSTGSILPRTGGMGTVALYAFGAILALAAVVVFTSKKRMQNVD